MATISRLKMPILVVILLALVGSVTLLGQTGLAARAATGASITLNPTFGPPGGNVKVSGVRFGNSETVTIALDTTQVGVATTNSTGAFTTTFTVPTTTQPGNHAVQATGQSSGLTATAPFTVGTNWPMYGYNTQHTHFNPYENILNTSNVPGLTQKWVNTTSYGVTSSPTIVNGEIYIGTNNCCGGGYLVALDEQTGKSNRAWTYSVGGTITTPVVASGIVYFAASNGVVYAVNAIAGTLVWSYPTIAGIYSSPTIANSIVYVSSTDENLYALDAKTGTLKWSYKTGSIIESSPAVANGLVYVGSYDQKLYALNALTGALKWSFTTGNSIYSSPTVANGMVYFGDQDFRVYALNASTGKLQWTYATGDQVNGSPAVANGIVYINSRDGNLYALNATTGVLKWSYNTGYDLASPAIANGVVYIGSDAFDAQAGTLLWSGGLNSDSSPVVVDGVLFTYVFYGSLYAFQ